MATMNYWNGTAWVQLDAKNADTIDNKHSTDFSPAPIISESEPVSGLSNGLMWYKASTGETKVYLNGAFRAISGSGDGGIVVSRKSNVSIPSSTNNVSINVPGYNKDTDTLLVFANSTFLQENVDYTISVDNLSINKVSGTWSMPTEFDFVVIMSISTNPSPLQLDRYTSEFVATADNTSVCLINQPMFDSVTDHLEVYYDNLLLYENENYAIANSSAINLSGFSINSGEKLKFVVWKKIRSDAAELAQIISVACLESEFVASSDGVSTVNINQAQYNKDTDILQVFYKNLLLYAPDNYSLNAGGTAIVLNGFTINTGEKVKFLVWKKVNTSLDTTDGFLLANNSVTNIKLATDIKVGSLANLLTTTKTDVVSAINELFTSVSNGKNTIASAITGKGVSATGSDSFSTLGTKISSIPSPSGDAVESNVLETKTFSNASGSKTGTMPNRAGDTAAISSSVSGTTLKLVASTGYRDGVDDAVTITDPDFIPGNIVSGKNIFGLDGSAVIPVIPTRGSMSWTTPGTYSWTPPAGVTKVNVTIVGATGGGGGGAGGGSYAPSGCGGSTTNGGNGGNGGTGGVTSFGAYASVSGTTGGSGGLGTGAGGAGGSNGGVAGGSGTTMTKYVGTGCNPTPYTTGISGSGGSRGGGAGGESLNYGDIYDGSIGAGGGGGFGLPLSTAVLATVTAGVAITVTVGAGGTAGTGGAANGGSDGKPGSTGINGYVLITW